MIERLLLALLLLGAGYLLFVLFRHRQKRLAGRQQQQASEITGGTDRPDLELLYFRSDACAPCVVQAHYLQQLGQTFAGRVQFRTVDVVEDMETAATFRVFTLPTTLIRDPAGQVQHINYGLTDAGKLAQQLEKLL